jgi:hypothetical protein
MPSVAGCANVNLQEVFIAGESLKHRAFFAAVDHNRVVFIGSGSMLFLLSLEGNLFLKRIYISSTAMSLRDTGALNSEAEIIRTGVVTTPQGGCLTLILARCKHSVFCTCIVKQLTFI